MPTTSNGETTIHYETFGDPAHPTLLLVNGLGSQLINWEPEFCQLLVAKGFHVVVFDNRDVGLTSKTDGSPPDFGAFMARLRAGESVSGVPYTLADMAADALAVADAVGAEEVHIAGMSMGGMIVQRMAIDHSDRVLSMTSIMSTTGAPGVGSATPEALESLVTPPPTNRQDYIEHVVETRRITGGSHYLADYWREQVAAAYDRNFNPVGSAFQMTAIAADGDRTAELGGISIPALVIHGRLDPLISLSGGEATAAAIPGAELLVIDSMGHDLPAPIWDQVVEAITSVAGLATS